MNVNYFQYLGPSCSSVCGSVKLAVSSNSDALIYSSPDQESALKDVHNLFNVADMQLGI